VEQQHPIRYCECFAFGLNPDHWESGFGERRAEGYAHSLHFVDRVTIFCPEHEFAVMRDAMVRYGAQEDRILWHQTHKTTYFNAQEMRKVMAERDLKRQQVCGASSWYHARAPFFADELHDLRISFVPAEAFTFAVAEEDSLPDLTEVMVREFGAGTRIIVDDIRGLGRRIAGRYQIPAQPT